MQLYRWCRSSQQHTNINFGLKMMITLSVFFALIIIYVTYRLWYLFQIRKKLSWLPAAKLIPFLGSSLEFGTDTVAILKNFQTLTNNPKKSVYFELGLGVYGILTRNEELMEFLLSSNKLEMLNKSAEYKFFGAWLGAGLLTSKGAKWKKSRRMITPAFHFSVLHQYVKAFESNGNTLIQRLKNEAVNQDGVDIYSFMTSYTLDVISESAMGVSIKSQEGKNKDYLESVKNACKVVVKRSFSAILANDYIFRLSRYHKIFYDGIKFMEDFDDKIINGRKEELKNENSHNTEVNSGSKRPRLAFLDLLLKSTIDGEPLSEKDIRKEVNTFMFAGHDTTSFALSMTLYLLATHPDIQTHARSEQREIFSENRDRTVTMEDLNDMTYLDLVIRESLRIHAPVPYIGRDITENVEFQGNIIPKGTRLLLFLYGVNRDPDYHEKSEEFIPERHLNLTEKYFSNIPFSAGPRNCIGRKFAVLEMKSTISKVLRNFELLPSDPDQKPILAMESTCKPINGINIMLKNYEWK